MVKQSPSTLAAVQRSTPNYRIHMTPTRTALLPYRHPLYGDSLLLLTMSTLTGLAIRTSLKSMMDRISFWTSWPQSVGTQHHQPMRLHWVHSPFASKPGTSSLLMVVDFTLHWRLSKQVCFFLCVKAPNSNTFGECQRPVYSHLVYPNLSILTNLWKFGLNWKSNLQENNERKNTLVSNRYFVCFQMHNKMLQLNYFVLKWVRIFLLKKKLR